MKSKEVKEVRKVRYELRLKDIFQSKSYIDYGDARVQASKLYEIAKEPIEIWRVASIGDREVAREITPAVIARSLEG